MTCLKRKRKQTAFAFEGHPMEMKWGYKVIREYVRIILLGLVCEILGIELHLNFKLFC